jgi:N-formylglutamate deformylase
MSSGTEHRPHDESLADLERRPFALTRPSHQLVPFVFAFPHSGRVYPDSFVDSSRLGATALRRSEDAYVDELFGSAASLGAPTIFARFPRAYLDVNRAPGELDPTMFDGALHMLADTTGARVNAGLGVIPRIVRDGAEIYRSKLPAREAEERIAKFYRPYHAALNALIEDTRREFGMAIVVDCHSMPSAAAVPDIVLGDRYGMSAANALMRGAERAFEQSAFTVARNAPYAGGYTTHLYGRPMLGIHALQIEINRALYLDEESIERSANFASVQTRIAEALDTLTMVEPALVRGPRAMRWAAE